MVSVHLVMMQEFLKNLKYFTNVNSEIVDPKDFKSANFVTKKCSEYALLFHQILLHSQERLKVFKIPKDIMCNVVWANQPMQDVE